MAISLVELREQARLLEAELTRQASVSDSIDTRAGMAIGFAGLIAGLLVQVKQSSTMLHAAVILALISAFIGVLAAFPRRFQSPDPDVVSDLYDNLPELQATALVAGVRVRAIDANAFICDSKRTLLSLGALVLVAAIVVAGLAVK